MDGNYTVRSEVPQGQASASPIELLPLDAVDLNLSLSMSAITNGYRLGDRVIDLDRQSLHGPDGEIALRPKSWAVLTYLVAHAGQLVKKDALKEAVWGQLVVTDASITQCLVDIRRSLGDEHHTLVRTIPRRGYILEAPIEPLEANPGRDDTLARRGLHRAGMVLLIAGLVTLAGLTWFSGDSNLRTGDSRSLTLLVSPFETLDTAEDPPTKRNLAEQVLEDLDGNTDIQVIASHSAFHNDASGQDAARQLGATHVVEGFVFQSEGEVQLSASLSRTNDNHRLWSGTYQLGSDDVATIPRKIATAIAQSLGVEWVSRSGDSDDAVARSLCHRGRYYYNRRYQGDMEQAQLNFQQALSIDPDYAHAWAGLVGVYLHRAFTGPNPDEEIRKMRMAADRARTLAPDDPVVALRSAMAMWHSGEPELALEWLRHAEALAPDNPLMLAMKSNIDMKGMDFSQAYSNSARAATLDPLNPTMLGNLAAIALMAGEYQATIDAYRALRPLNEDIAISHKDTALLAHVLLGDTVETTLLLSELQANPGKTNSSTLIVALEHTGQHDAAESRLRELATQDEPGNQIEVAAVLAWRGDTSAVLDTLGDLINQLPEPGSPTLNLWRDLVHQMYSPLLIPFRDTPQYQELHQELLDRERHALNSITGV